MDKREEILLKEFDVGSEDCQTWPEDIQLAIVLNPDIVKIKNAMDENGKRLCLDLLEYMARCQVKCTSGVTEPLFYYKNEWISAKELFENFL